MLEQPTTDDGSDRNGDTRLAPHKPIARARSPRSVKTLVSKESVAGKVIVVPRPMTARVAISSGAVVTRPPATLAKPNTVKPANNIPLRPNRSDKLPAVRMTAANTRL